MTNYVLTFRGQPGRTPTAEEEVRAIALGEAHGPQAGLHALDELSGEPQLAGYHYLAAARRIPAPPGPHRRRPPRL